MYCNQCRESVPEGSTFCLSCGTRIGIISATSGSLNYGTVGRVAAIVGGILIVIGSLLPWATANNAIRSYAYNGMDGAGGFSLALGLLIIIGAFIRFNRPGSRAYVALIFSVLAIAFGSILFAGISSEIQDVEASNPFAEASIGIGVYFIILGGVLGLATILPNSKSPHMDETTQNKDHRRHSIRFWRNPEFNGWINRHLNWTAILGCLTVIPIIVIAAIIMGSIAAMADTDGESQVPNWISELVINIVIFTTPLATLGWVLKKKLRSLAWLLIAFIPIFGWTIPIILDNRGQTPSSVVPQQ